MTFLKHNGELLTERRSESGVRVMRRGRRFRRFYKLRMLHWVFLLAALFLMCSTALKFWFNGNLECWELGFQEVQQKTSNAVKPPRGNRGRKYAPCKIGFSESVNELVEPKNFMNFSQFSLDYIYKEDKPSRTNSYELGFGGHQTIQEREKSFLAENQTLHCGFVKGQPRFLSNGFDLDEKDRTYMNTNKVVVSSCIFGSSDFLRRPTTKRVKFYLL